MNVDDRAQRPSQPHFIVGDKRKFLPLHVDVSEAPLSPLSSCVDSHTRVKRLYAAAHAPLAPPTTPIVDLSCRERNLLSSSSSDSDSDYPPTASQRENRPPLLGSRLRNPSGSSDLSTAMDADALKQSLQLTTQLAATVQQQLERTQNEAAQRENRIFNDIAEREHRLLVDAAERDRRIRDENSNREHALMKDAASVRDALLADGQHAREMEAERERRLLDDMQQRERDLRRDMYDMAAQRSRAAALEAELSCLKANIGSSTVAPVQSVDIAPPEVATAIPLSPLRSVTPTVVQRSDIVTSLTSYSDGADARTECADRDAEISTLSRPSLFCETDALTAQNIQRPSLSFDASELTAQYMPPRSSAVTDLVHTHMPMPAFPRTRSPPAPVGAQYTEPQMSDLGSAHRSDTPSRRLPHTFSRSASAASRPPAAPVQDVMTSMMPPRPPPVDELMTSMPIRPFAPSVPVGEVMTSAALPRPLAVPVDHTMTSTALPRQPAAAVSDPVLPPYQAHMTLHTFSRLPPDSTDVLTSIALPRQLDIRATMFDSVHTCVPVPAFTHSLPVRRM